MLTLTRKADYALVALAHLAIQGDTRSSARAISERNRVPLPMLTNILHQLLQNGLITSTLGSKGGYRLARRPEEISIRDLIDAVEGPFKLATCCGNDAERDWTEPACDLEADCRIKGSVRMVHDRMLEFLEQIKIAHIVAGNLPVQLTVPRPSEAKVSCPSVARL